MFHSTGLFDSFIEIRGASPVMNFLSINSEANATSVIKISSPTSTPVTITNSVFNSSSVKYGTKFRRNFLIFNRDLCVCARPRKSSEN